MLVQSFLRGKSLCLYLLKGCEIMDFYTETFVLPEKLLLAESNA